MDINLKVEKSLLAGYRGCDMLTLEVNGRLVTWPEEFAAVMIRYYSQFGVPFKIHRNCIHSGSNSIS